MPGTPSKEDYRRTLEEASVDLLGLTLHDDGSVGPPDDGPDTLDEPPGAEALPTFASAEGGPAELEPIAPLGEGGTGIVQIATQAALRREVAIKTLRAGARSPSRDRAFIREARVTGILEHPSIVPIHALVRGPNDEPVIVMKKVEGRPWRQVMKASHGASDHLETNLEILSATCRAIELAHSRGVLHRDLKPDNVLVGDFGEVTVVDWGLAVALGEPLVEGMPRARDVNGVVGTPRYMAPEMAAAQGDRIDERTDVYLLGAILHEILTGETRHDGETLMDMLYAAYASEPASYPPSVPVELGVIANRACHAEPSARYGSVAELRAALAGYREHASARAWLEDATARLSAAKDAEDEQAATLLTECRFAFERTLDVWPESEAAREGLTRTVLSMVERALARKELTTAEALLDQLGDAKGALADEVAALRAEVEDRAARLRALEARAREQDLGAAAQRRRRFGVGFGILFALANVVLGVLDRLGVMRLDHVGYVAASGAVALSVLVPALPRWSSMVPNRATKRLVSALALLLLMQAPTFLCLGWLGVDLPRSLGASLFQLGAAVMVGSMMVRPRVVAAGLFAVAMGAVALLWPPSAYFCVGAAYGVFVVWGSLLSWDDFMGGA